MSSDTVINFQRDMIRAFRFVRCAFDAKTGIAQLVYAFDDGPELTETVTVPGAPFVLDDARAAAAERALRLLHLIAGVSYYKAAVPPAIAIDSYAIDADTAALLETIYLNGLGEFAYRNGLNLHGRIVFPVGGASAPTAETIGAEAPPTGVRSLGLSEHALVAIGGGKDSLVSIEALRSIGVVQTVTWIGGSQLIKVCAERTGLPTLNLGRQLAPELFEYNRLGAWNGHIPVTAVNSAILVFAAVLIGADQVVFSNERSASYGSFIEGTGEVNHQWSKGWAFEQAFGEHVQRRIAADLKYYSLLRPLSELAVARQFAKISRYDAHFSSCNRNFHILGERPVNRWCGVCPKCHFVFLALAPFMPKPRLVGIFGRNLLDDAAQIAGYDALLEYQDHKPFECVGEGRESRAAMATLSERPEWREDEIVERFAREIRPQLSPLEQQIAPLLVIDDEHRVPSAVWNACVRISSLDGKRVALWGWGREGRAAYRALRRRLPTLSMTLFCGSGEIDEARALGDALLTIETDASAERLSAFDVVVKSPGISPYKPEALEAAQRGTRFIGGTTLWFAEHADARTVCVTGTKGKSTTTALLAHLLRAGGHRTALCGNIGMPLLELLDVEQPPEFWAIELSSYQTRDVAASGVSPEIAVATNVFPEHLDWHGSEARYIDDKLALLTVAKPRIAILNANDRTLAALSLPDSDVRFFGDADGWHLRDDIVHRSERAIFDTRDLPLPGRHNRGNLCAVLAAIEALGLDAAALAPHATSFQPLPHRLQILGARDGITYVNDSISTTPHASLAALDCFRARRVAILVGGHDRGIDWHDFADAMRTQAPAVIVTLGQNGPKIHDLLTPIVNAGHFALAAATDLGEAVARARELLDGEGVLLLSPGAPSFGNYRDYTERGRHFASLAGFDPEAIASIPGLGIG